MKTLLASETQVSKKYIEDKVYLIKRYREAKIFLLGKKGIKILNNSLSKLQEKVSAALHIAH